VLKRCASVRDPPRQNASAADQPASSGAGWPLAARAAWPLRIRLAPNQAVQLALLGVAAVLLWRLADVLLLLFFAVLIASVVRGSADALAKGLSISPRIMLALVTISLTLAVVALAYWIGPAIADQVSDLAGRLSSFLNTLRNQYGHTMIGHAVNGGGSGSQALASGMMGHLSSVATSVLDAVADLFVIVVISLYLAITPRLYVDGVVRLVPIAHRPLARSVIEEIGRDMRLWFLGQLCDMLVVGILSAVGFYLAGVPVPFALATLAGLFTVVPYFGAFAAGVPAVIVALTQTWMTAIWVLLILLICHVVEGYIVAPLVQRRIVHIPPALLISSMTVAGTLFGRLGIVLGAPLAVGTMVAVKRLYVEQVLGDRDPQV
jgi:predicted PurR-regulated permease PerM